MSNSQLKKDVIRNLQSTEFKNYLISNEEINLLSGWIYILMFLHDAKTSLNISELNQKNKITDVEEVILSHGMFKNFILSYSKCFSSSGKRKISLDANEIFSSCKDLKIIHDSILQIRNTYVAHNDRNEFHISISFTSENENEIVLAQTYTLMTPLGNYKNYKEILEFCEQQVVSKLSKKIDKIELRIGKKIKFK